MKHPLDTPSDRPPTTAENAPALDRHVGNRIRQRRTELGLSAEGLARRLGLTAQEMLGWEQGRGSFGAHLLSDLARALEVPLGFFLDGLPPVPACAGASMASLPSMAEELKRDSLDLLRAFHRIGDPAIRRWMIELAHTLTDHGR